ncbi:hypothetical protein ACTVZO_35885 [Streptomyces sp. IBSNAI002]|uniref:hypothetical protein n=1 Tax=Streptomyces sp. IBSNAI002 TaxID=3457500 RepID=UPI003FD4F1BF
MADRAARRLTVRLRRTDGSWQVVRNHAWPVALIPALLQRSGFRDVVRHRPTCAAAAGDHHGGGLSEQGRRSSCGSAVGESPWAKARCPC